MKINPKITEMNRDKNTTDFDGVYLNKNNKKRKMSEKAIVNLIEEINEEIKKRDIPIRILRRILRKVQRFDIKPKLKRESD